MNRTTYATLATLGACLLGCLAAAPRAVEAQGFGERLKRAAAEAAARRVEERVEKRSGEATDAALDGAEARARRAARDSAAAKDTPPPPKATPAPTVTKDAPAADTSATPVPRAVNAGSDFTPGARTLFATTFARDEIGDFPRALRLRGGNAEVAEIGGTRWLRATSSGEFDIPLPERLPERFTLEMDFTGPGGSHQELHFGGTSEGEGFHVMLRPSDGGVEGPDNYRVVTETKGVKEDVPFRVQIMADGDYVKVYMNGTRVANAPNAALGRATFVRIKTVAYADAPLLIGDVRIAAGGKDLYAALEASGRVTADGILFDTNSDRIREESAPALKEIADMLAAHPALRVAIEGHTDDVGGAAANQTLSVKRAAAVQRHLVTLGADPARLESAGFGATRPVAPNDSEANRQKNRRVELVKR